MFCDTSVLNSNPLHPPEARYNLDQHAKTLSGVQKQIGAKKKAKENADELIAEIEKIKAGETALAEAEKHAKLALDAALQRIGNLVHQSVPVSKDEVRFVKIRENCYTYRSK